MDVKPVEDGLPKKRSGAGALIFDESGRLLIVKPSYRDGWLVPGGVVEAGESPKAACEREVLEETGLALRMQHLLCVDYWRGNGEQSESLQFLFHGGCVTPDQIAGIHLCEYELTEYRFVEPGTALLLLAERLATRVESCLTERSSGRTAYLEAGRPIL